MKSKKYVDFDEVITTYKTFGHLNLPNALEAFNEIPAADVRPVVRGKWDEEHEPFTWMGYTRWSCSCCGFKCGYELEIKNRTNFCPNCGADMRGINE